MIKRPNYNAVVVKVEEAHFEPASQEELIAMVAQAMSSNEIANEDNPAFSMESLVVKMSLGPAFKYVRPLDNEFKDLGVRSITLDGAKVILGGVIEPAIKAGIDGCDFAFVADPYRDKQALRVISSRSGSLGFIVDEVAASLPKIK